MALTWHWHGTDMAVAHPSQARTSNQPQSHHDHCFARTTIAHPGQARKSNQPQSHHHHCFARATIAHPGQARKSNQPQRRHAHCFARATIGHPGQAHESNQPKPRHDHCFARAAGHNVPANTDHTSAALGMSASPGAISKSWPDSREQPATSLRLAGAHGRAAGTSNAKARGHEKHTGRRARLTPFRLRSRSRWRRRRRRRQWRLCESPLA